MLTRRTLIKAIGATGIAAAGQFPRPSIAAARLIKIGLVTPASGPLAPFASADAFVLDQLKDLFAAGVTVGGQTYPIQVIVKDSQSTSSRAAEVASELIDGEGVDLICAAGTADTTNSTADQAEAAGVPAITTDSPWEAHFFGRRGDPAKGFEWTSHFFWGSRQLTEAYLGIWKLKETNKVIGSIWSNDPDGVAIEKTMSDAIAKDGGFKHVDAGLFAPLSTDYSSQISKFKSAGAEIVCGLMLPPDFATFWTQCAQQGFKPKIMTCAKALLFPQSVDALGDRGTGLTTELWWSPHHPFKSSLTGQSADELCENFESKTGGQWVPPLGFKHALFEVIINVLKRSASLKAADIRDAIKATDMRTIAGPVNFKTGPVPGISEMPLVGGQWVKGSKFPHAQAVIFDGIAPEIPVTAELQLL